MKKNSLFVFLFGLCIIIALGSTSSAQQKPYVYVQQRIEGQLYTQQISLFQGSESAKKFYNYRISASSTGLEQSNTSLIIPYRSPQGTVSLIFIHDKPNDGSSGKAQFKVGGIPRGATLSLFDDKSDKRDTYSFNPPWASFSWTWYGQNGDGAVISGTGEEANIRIIPSFERGISKWKVVSGTPENPDYYELSPNSPLQFFLSSNHPPKTVFSAPDQPVVDKPVSFDASASSDPDGNVIKYEWDFDDDGKFEVTTEKSIVRKTFTEPGSYNVTLRVVDDEGAVDLTTKSIVVKQPIISVVRSVSTTEIMPDKKFKVTLRISCREAVVGLAVQELLPFDWEAEPDAVEAKNFEILEEEGRVSWKFHGTQLPDKNFEISYTVQVPSKQNLGMTQLPTRVSLEGNVILESPEYESAIKGISTIRLADILSPKTVLSHYDADRGAIDFQQEGDLTTQQLEWAAQLWKSDGTIPLTGGEKVSFELLRNLITHHLTETPVETDIPQGPISNFSAERTVYTRLPSNTILLGYKSQNSEQYSGDTYRVELSVTAGDRSMKGVGVNEEIPDDWIVTPIDNGGAIYKPTTNQWVFLQPIPQNSQLSITYKVSLPQDSQTTSYRLLGRIYEDWSDYSLEIGKDTQIQVVDSLSPSVVLSHWNVETDQFDLSLGDLISYNQVKKALALWLEDVPVPYTGGKQLTLSDIRKIVAHWEERKPVTAVLD